MDIDAFQAFLRDLRDHGGCRLGGSMALHREDLRGHVSDIDLICPDRTKDDYGEVIDEPIRRCIEVYERHGVPWDSVAPGTISSPRDLVTLPRPVEVIEEMWIRGRDDPQPADTCREVYGVRLETWRSPQ